jgi:hypothetical protein
MAIPYVLSTENFHLGIARSAYVGGSLDIDEFECSVEHVLSGGALDRNGRIPAKGPGALPGKRIRS